MKECEMGSPPPLVRSGDSRPRVDPPSADRWRRAGCCVLHGRVPHDAVLRHGHLGNLHLCWLRFLIWLGRGLLAGVWSALHLGWDEVACLTGRGYQHGIRVHLRLPPAFLLLLSGAVVPPLFPHLLLHLVLLMAMTGQVEVLVLVEDQGDAGRMVAIRLLHRRRRVQLALGHLKQH